MFLQFQFPLWTIETIGEVNTVKQANRTYEGRLIYSGKQCQLEQLFEKDKFDPQDDQCKPLNELMTILLNKEAKRKRKQGIRYKYMYIYSA